MTTVYFATNRNKLKGKNFGDRFHADGPHFYRFGQAEVTWNRTGPGGKVLDWDDYSTAWKLAKETAPPAAALTGVPEMHKKKKEGKKVVRGSSEIFQALRSQMQADGRDALVYIHGFANDFDNALARAAQLAETYRITPKNGGTVYQPYVLAFSWPSNGRVQPPWEYASDREDAALSGLAMARALCRFVDFLNQGEPCPCRLHLVTHSMGNWALRHAVLGLHTLNGGQTLPKLFDNALMMAADEDDDCFEDKNKLGLLPELARRIHVYHSGSDLALEVSDKTKFNQDRLGTDGPRTFSGISNRVVALDCTDVDSTTLAHANHQYYRLRPEVIADVCHVLSGRTPLDRFPNRDPIEPGRRYRILPAAG